MNLQRYFSGFTFNFIKHHALPLFCSNKPMHRQELQTLNQQVLMPLASDRKSPNQMQSSDKHQDPTEVAKSCTILTTPANVSKSS